MAKKVKTKNENPSLIERQKQLSQLSCELNLTAIRDNIGLLIDTAQQQELSYSDFALSLLELENNTRQERRLIRNRKQSKLPMGYLSLDDFDFSLRPKLESRVVKELLNCRWVQDQGRSIICVGRPGLGKTHVLDALGLAACRLGYTVLKVDTAEMLDQLQASLVDGSYKLTFRRYNKPSILYMDEFGYEPFDAKATKHLFRLVSARYRTGSIMLAANTGFKQWKNFFPSEAQAVATVDRLIDRSTILRFTGKSMRQPKVISGAETD